jgi:hypothetical protein
LFFVVVVELMRLMGTAKDNMRRAIIQESLNNLDSPERTHSKKIGQGIPNIFETEKVDWEAALIALNSFPSLVGWKKFFEVDSHSTSECKDEKTFNE